jgi:osmotically-inducible protein OsmY
VLHRRRDRQTRKSHAKHHPQARNPVRYSVRGDGIGLRLDGETGRHGEYVDDTVITGKVKAAILNEPTLKSAEINVERSRAWSS